VFSQSRQTEEYARHAWNTPLWIGECDGTAFLGVVFLLATDRPTKERDWGAIFLDGGDGYSGTVRLQAGSSAILAGEWPISDRKREGVP
jgi:hypothetical protein